MNRLRVAFVLLSCLMSACMMRKASVWILEGSTGEALRFAIGSELGGDRPIASLQSVRVSACLVDEAVIYSSDRVLWEAVGNAAERDDRRGTIAYGVPPRGLRTRVGPEALEPGCYQIAISGSGVSAVACFTVDATGAVPAPVDPRSTCGVRRSTT